MRPICVALHAHIVSHQQSHVDYVCISETTLCWEPAFMLLVMLQGNFTFDSHDASKEALRQQ